MKRRLTFFTALLLLLFVGNAQSQTSAHEYQIKALFIFNFLKYVDWPQECFANDESPISIGVLGKNPFNGYLQAAISGKSIGNRPVILRPIEDTKDLASFHLIFIGASESYQLDQVLKQTASLPILTVGEHPLFLDRGGIINFLLVGDRIQLEINLQTSRSNGLQISSRLLSVADRVVDK